MSKWQHKCKTRAGVASRIRISTILIKEREQWLRNPWSKAGIPIMQESIKTELRNIEEMTQELRRFIDTNTGHFNQEIYLD